MKILKKLDIVVILFLIIISFTPHIILARSLNKDYDTKYVEIKVVNKEYKSINISNIASTQKFEIKTDKSLNIIHIEKATVKIIHANCKDSLCVKQKSISKVGQSIICLPNKVVVEIKGDMNDTSDEDIILSH